MLVTYNYALYCVVQYSGCSVSHGKRVIKSVNLAGYMC